jgi:hypothetical protein
MMQNDPEIDAQERSERPTEWYRAPRLTSTRPNERAVWPSAGPEEERASRLTWENAGRGDAGARRGRHDE